MTLSVNLLYDDCAKKSQTSIVVTITYIPTLAFLCYCAHIIIDVDSHMEKQILLIQYVSAILSVFLALCVGEILIFDLWGVGSCAPYSY